MITEKSLLCFFFLFSRELCTKLVMSSSCHPAHFAQLHRFFFSHQHKSNLKNYNVKMKLQGTKPPQEYSKINAAA